MDKGRPESVGTPSESDHDDGLEVDNEPLNADQGDDTLMGGLEDLDPGIRDTVGNNVPMAKLNEREKKELKRSRHGISYPPLPSSMIQKILKTTVRSSGAGRLKLSKDVLAAITQASDWFFEQIGEDLGAYASHARRKTIDESDVVTLMRR